MSRDEPKLAKLDELPEIFQAAFADIKKIDTEIAFLTEKHISPLRTDRTAAIRQLKGKTGLSRQVILHGYKGYCLDKKPDDFENDNAAQALRNEMRIMFDALRQGEMLNFLLPLEASDTSHVRAPAARSQKAGKKGAAPTLAVTSAPTIRKDTTWNQGSEASGGAQSTNPLELALQAGEKAALAGTDCAAAIKAKGWHHASAPAKKFREGYEKGNSSRLDKGTAEVTSEKTAEQPPAHTGGYIFKYGMEAAEAGKPVTDNPYPSGSNSAAAWNSGWLSAGKKTPATKEPPAGYTGTTGETAAIDGAPRDSNPHEAGSPAFEAWDKGWEAGAEKRAKAQHIVNGMLSGNQTDAAGNAAPNPEDAADAHKEETVDA